MEHIKKKDLQCQLQFKKITEENLYEIVGLSVREDQKSYVASNCASIMDAYVSITNDGVVKPFGIYDGDVAVGFIMFAYGAKKYDNIPQIAYQNYCIWRFMIDQKYQSKGYGKAALEAALIYMRTEALGKGEYCWLSYEPDNQAAKGLYGSMGFEETGELFYGECVAVRKI